MISKMIKIIPNEFVKDNEVWSSPSAYVFLRDFMERVNKLEKVAKIAAKILDQSPCELDDCKACDLKEALDDLKRDVPIDRSVK